MLRLLVFNLVALSVYGGSHRLVNPSDPVDPASNPTGLSNDTAIVRIPAELNATDLTVGSCCSPFGPREGFTYSDSTWISATERKNLTWIFHAYTAPTYPRRKCFPFIDNVYKAFWRSLDSERISVRQTLPQLRFSSDTSPELVIDLDPPPDGRGPLTYDIAVQTILAIRAYIRQYSIVANVRSAQISVFEGATMLPATELARGGFYLRQAWNDLPPS